MRRSKVPVVLSLSKPIPDMRKTKKNTKNPTSMEISISKKVVSLFPYTYYVSITGETFSGFSEDVFSWS